MFRSIKTKIMVLQIGLVLVVSAALGGASYIIALKSITNDQKDELQYFAKHTVEHFTMLIEDREQSLEKIGNSEAVVHYFTKQQENFLVGYLEKFSSEFPSISYVNPNGQEELKLVYGKPVVNFTNISNYKVFKQAVQTPNKSFSQYRDYAAELDAPCIEVGFCEKDFFDNVLGFILARVPIEQLTGNIHHFNNNPEMSVILIDSAGFVLAAPDKNKLYRKLETANGGLEQILTTFQKPHTGFMRTKLGGIDSYIAYAPMENKDLCIITMYPYEGFNKKLASLRNTVILIGLTVLIAGVVLSIFLSADITRPISKLLHITSLIANGDFSQRVDTNAKDELGQLALSFNQMMENLRATTTSMVNLNKEISERQKAEAAQHHLNIQLEQSVKDLTLANRELSDFAHVAAHDLKAPLRAIGSLAGILMTDYGKHLDEQGKYYLHTLIKRTERLSELISGILTYSELGRANDILPVNVNDTLRQIIANTEIPSNIVIVFETDFPTLICSKTHIQQIFQNLINNAIKFMDKPNGYIRIKCTDEGQYWKFSVADNGRGIDEKYFDKIFKIFQTLTRRDEQESTGIGLSVVKRIVEKYDGKIWVESQPTVGSTFHFTLRKEKTEAHNAKLQTNFVS
jgi:signal transduction histidine kinase